jgi:hypothetical protein
MTIATPRNTSEQYVFEFAHPDDLDRTAVVLDRAALVLEEFGWIKGRAGNRISGFCAIGAIQHARRELHNQLGGYEYSSSMVDAVTDGDNIVHFNDNVATRKRDVQRKLRRAARRARALARAKRLQKVGV